MPQITTTNGTRRVISFANNYEGATWHSRLYVNDGETATLTARKHSTEAGAIKWAKKVLGLK